MMSPRVVLVAALLVASVATAAPTEEPPALVLSWGSLGNGDGQMRWPYGLATDAQGNVYVADMGNHRIQRFTNTGVFSSQFGAFGMDPGQFFQPEGIAIAPDGRIYVVEYGTQRVQVFSPDASYLTQWQSGFSRPQGIAVGPDGSVYVADTGNNRIQKFTADGVFLLQWGSVGTDPGQFRHPTGIATDHLGNVYVADYINGRVQKFTAQGALIAVWPLPDEPYYLATDASDNLYVTVWPNSVAKFSAAGVLLTQWGSFGYGSGLFSYPTGIAVDLSGNVFVAESHAVGGDFSLIQKFSPSAVPTTRKTWGQLKARFR